MLKKGEDSDHNIFLFIFLVVVAQTYNYEQKQNKLFTSLPPPHALDQIWDRGIRRKGMTACSCDCLFLTSSSTCFLFPSSSWQLKSPFFRILNANGTSLDWMHCVPCRRLTCLYPVCTHTHTHTSDDNAVCFVRTSLTMLMRVRVPLKFFESIVLHLFAQFCNVGCVEEQHRLSTFVRLLLNRIHQLLSNPFDNVSKNVTCVVPPSILFFWRISRPRKLVFGSWFFLIIFC